MASLTIPFPEGTRTLVLRGNRITIGRLPDNTIQIRDRTISAYHAEIVRDGDHYLIRDIDSTNGIVVTNERVSDFHLREDCKVNLGGVACDFRLADPPATIQHCLLATTASQRTIDEQQFARLRSGLTTGCTVQSCFILSILLKWLGTALESVPSPGREPEEPP